VIALGAGLAGWRLARLDAPAERVVGVPAGLWSAASAAYGVDGLVMRTIGPVLSGAERLAEGFDRRIVDGAVNGIGWLARQVGKWSTALQSGESSLYAAYVGFGAVLLVSLALWLGQ
jgi:hypothetical protein